MLLPADQQGLLIGGLVVGGVMLLMVIIVCCYCRPKSQKVQLLKRHAKSREPAIGMEALDVDDKAPIQETNCQVDNPSYEEDSANGTHKKRVRFHCDLKRPNTGTEPPPTSAPTTEPPASAPSAPLPSYAKPKSQDASRFYVGPT